MLHPLCAAGLTFGAGVKIWPDSATNSYTLEQAAKLNAGNGAWTTSGYAISSANGTNSITVAAPVGQLFFRLKQ